MDLPLADRSLEHSRAEEIERAQILPARLACADYAFASEPILRAFAKAAPGDRPAQLALPSTSPSAQLVPASSVRSAGELLLFDLFLDPKPGMTLEALRAEAVPVVVDWRSRTWRRELFRVGAEPHHLDLPADGAFAAHFEHWVHFLWAGPWMVPLLCARRPGRRMRSRGAELDSYVGPGATIHPGAFLEGSIVGAGASIGASVSLRSSYVGPHARITDFSKVGWSVLGEGTHTLADASFEHVVAFGGGTLASLALRDSILGRNVFLTTGVIFWTDALSGTVEIEAAGRRVDSKRKCLGGCAGHGSVLGARTILTPGVALPNRITIVMRKEEGVFAIEDVAPGTPMCWDKGALVPYDKLRPGQRPEEL